MHKVTQAEAITLLENAVKDKGSEHTVAACTYAAACIGGHVLQQLGADIEDLLFFDKDDDVDGDTGFAHLASLNVFEKRLSVRFSGRAAAVIGEAQRVQDGVSAHTWGDALQAARRFAE